MPRRSAAKMVLDEIYQGGMHSERILLILLKIKCLPESEVSNSRNSGEAEVLRCSKGQNYKNMRKTETPKVDMLLKVQKVIFFLNKHFT